MGIDKVPEKGYADPQDHQHGRRDVHNQYVVLVVIETRRLDLTSQEGKDNGSSMETELVRDAEAFVDNQGHVSLTAPESELFNFSSTLHNAIMEMLVVRMDNILSITELDTSPVLYTIPLWKV